MQATAARLRFGQGKLAPLAAMATTSISVVGAML
jgi:hypothetical protein